jgi:CheY-like chemotaxis protein
MTMCSQRLQGLDDSAEAGELRSPLVLIVDDDSDARTIYIEILNSRGFRTIEAANGEAAIEMAVREHPDVILMDGSMPGMSGQDAALRLRGDRLTHAIPIVMLSGSMPPPRAAAAADAASKSRGGSPTTPPSWDAYITKPCSADDITATLRSVLSKSERTQVSH